MMDEASLRVTTDPGGMDMDLIHEFLSTSAWARGISRELVQKSMEQSLCFALWRGDEQIGFARLITDRATFAYLADVFVAVAWRGQGYGSWLMRRVMSHPEVKSLRRILLATSDAHAWYRRFGFLPLGNPEDYMTIHRPSSPA